jgi:rRNA maturation endonuclease Nob1
MINCIDCNHENDDKWKFCTECGNSLDMKCTKCLIQLPADANFCSHCGQKAILKLNSDKNVNLNNRDHRKVFYS